MRCLRGEDRVRGEVGEVFEGGRPSEGEGRVRGGGGGGGLPGRWMRGEVQVTVNAQVQFIA